MQEDCFNSIVRSSGEEGSRVERSRTKSTSTASTSYAGWTVKSFRPARDHRDLRAPPELQRTALHIKNAGKRPLFAPTVVGLRESSTTPYSQHPSTWGPPTVSTSAPGYHAFVDLGFCLESLLLNDTHNSDEAPVEEALTFIGYETDYMEPDEFLSRRQDVESWLYKVRTSHSQQFLTTSD